MNHARRLAEDDWTGMESEDEDTKDDTEMDIDTGKKLPKRYANQVSGPEMTRLESPLFDLLSSVITATNRKKKDEEEMEEDVTDHMTQSREWSREGGTGITFSRTVGQHIWAKESECVRRQHWEI